MKSLYNQSESFDASMSHGLNLAQSSPHEMLQFAVQHSMILIWFNVNPNTKNSSRSMP